MLTESIDNTDVPEIMIKNQRTGKRKFSYSRKATEVWRCRVLALPLWISEKGLTSPVVWYFYHPER